ncbi:protein kinase [Myxococcota bacterium]|nr:protein kinase [Myxococcota bacterium]
MAGPHLAQPFGRYVLREVAGIGAMGQVYRAVRRGPMGFRKDVALKQILPEVAADPDRLLGFVNEARVGGFLRHPNLVEVYEFDQVEGTYYLAMEFVDGWSLSQLFQRARIEGRPAPPRAVAEMGIQVCAGLAWAHEAVDDAGQPLRLVHRDLKPGNLLVSRSGTVKVADFGIAQASSNLFQRVDHDLAQGTPGYMSPEQVRGDPMDGRSDLFALAAVLVEAALLRPLFPYDGDIASALRRIDRVEAAGALREMERIGRPVAEVLRRALTRTPEERIPSARALAEGLRGALERIPAGPGLLAWLDALHPGAVVEPPPTVAGLPLVSAAGPAVLAPRISAPLEVPPTGREEPSPSHPQAPGRDADRTPTLGSVEPPAGRRGGSGSRRRRGWGAAAGAAGLGGAALAVVLLLRAGEGDGIGGAPPPSAAPAPLRLAPLALPPATPGGLDRWALALGGVPLVEIGEGDPARMRASALAEVVEEALASGDPRALRVERGPRRATLVVEPPGGPEVAVVDEAPGPGDRASWQRDVLLDGWGAIRDGTPPRLTAGTPAGDLLARLAAGLDAAEIEAGEAQAVLLSPPSPPGAGRGSD